MQRQSISMENYYNGGSKRVERDTLWDRLAYKLYKNINHFIFFKLVCLIRLYYITEH